VRLISAVGWSASASAPQQSKSNGGLTHLEALERLHLGTESFSRRAYSLAVGQRIRRMTVTHAREALQRADLRYQPTLVCPSPEAGAELDPALVVSGSSATLAGVRFAPNSDSTGGVIALGVETASSAPSTFLTTRHDDGRLDSGFEGDRSALQ
jgi:hypothetical protein